MSCAHSLEVRVPFLDKEVFKVARTLPTKFKVNKENTKYAMRMASHRYLPDMVAEKKKLGFPVPIRVWLKEDKYYHIVKEAFTSKAAQTWTIYMFLVWHKQFFETERV